MGALRPSLLVLVGETHHVSAESFSPEHLRAVTDHGHVKLKHGTHILRRRAIPLEWTRNKWLRLDFFQDVCNLCIQFFDRFSILFNRFNLFVLLFIQFCTFAGKEENRRQ